MIIVAEPDQVETDLAAGVLACPRCAGVLRPWAYAASRPIRRLDGSTRTMRPRRARCTHLPRHPRGPARRAASPPRRRHRGHRRRAASQGPGRGWRRIAAELGRPPSTVRRWLRAARGTHPGWLYRQGITHAAQLDPEVLATGPSPQPTALGDALAALAAAVTAWRHRFARHAEAWTLIGVFTRGRLLAPT